MNSVDGSGLLLIDDDIEWISKSQFLSHFLLFPMSFPIYKSCIAQVKI